MSDIRFFEKAGAKRSVILIVLLLCSYTLLSFSGAEVYAAEEETSEYTYSVEITFGAFSFYYDYGIWNVNTLEYEASEQSKDPAVDTNPGKPGWYGFDGATNRISVNYLTGSEGTSIDVIVVYTPWYMENGNKIEPDIIMEAYKSKDFSSFTNEDAENYRYGIIDNPAFEIISGMGSGFGFNVPVGTMSEAYISLSGEPGFHSGGAVVIGELTLMISPVKKA